MRNWKKFARILIWLFTAFVCRIISIRVTTFSLQHLRRLFHLINLNYYFSPWNHATVAGLLTGGQPGNLRTYPYSDVQKRFFKYYSMHSPIPRTQNIFEFILVLNLERCYQHDNFKFLLKLTLELRTQSQIKESTYSPYNYVHVGQNCKSII